MVAFLQEYCSSRLENLPTQLQHQHQSIAQPNISSLTSAINFHNYDLRFKLVGLGERMQTPLPPLTREEAEREATR